MTAAVGGLLLCAVAGFAQRQPSGVAPRSSGADYTAHLTVAGVTYAASLVSPNEAKHIFAFDISKSYVVFEVALYPQPLHPQQGSALELDPDGFAVRSSQAGDPVRPTDAVTVASVIQQKNLPARPSSTGSVTASTAIGYESGRDPVTGRRVHGTYTDTQVGVGALDDGPPPMPTPGGYPQDRELLEDQLWAKSLPGGPVVHATAGYLYFPSSLLKKKSSGTYELEYLGAAQEPVLSGSASQQRIQLRIPAKSR